MKKSHYIFQLFILVMFLPCLLYAQEEQRKTATTPGLSGITKNVIIGYAYTDFAYNPSALVKSNFSRMGFSPTMIWKLGDNLFFESQVEFYTDSGRIVTGVEYGKLTYMVSKYLYVGMGKMMTPFGTYSERFEAPFIERFPNAPLGFKPQEGVPMVGPTGSEIGIDFRGSTYLGKGKLSYVLYITNGGRLNDGKKEEKLAGSLSYENFFDNNSNKAIGGRIGWLPLSNSSLELGLSTQQSKVGDAGTKYENIQSHAYAFDVSYVKPIPDIHVLFNVKGQYNVLKVDKADYEDENGNAYTFENNSNMWYARVSARAAYVKNSWLKNTEYMVRYSEVNYAKDALWGGQTRRLDLGISYWFSLRTGLRLAWEKSQGNVSNEVIMARFVTGF